MTYFVGDLVDGLHDKLTQQIARALRYDYDMTEHADCDRQTLEDFEAAGQEHAITFLESLPEVRSLLATDVQAAFDGDPAARNLDEIIFCYPGLQAVTVHRLAHQLYRQGVPLIPRIMSEWSHGQTGIDIHPGAKLGRRSSSITEPVS